ncbi:hypothetical protein, partial [Acutalibacter muris]|uniref:hypothetical protein n=1 Tax=Acutalibacter muris TaxID=1796620 RepID=UPI003FA4894C
CIHQNHIFRVRLNQSIILPVFFAEYLQHQKAKRYFLGRAAGNCGLGHGAGLQQVNEGVRDL